MEAPLVSALWKPSGVLVWYEGGRGYPARAWRDPPLPRDKARPSPFFVLGLPHVTLIELRLALISYQDYHMLLLTLAGRRWPCIGIAGACPSLALSDQIAGFAFLLRLVLR